MIFFKRTESQARARGFVSTKILSEGDKRVDSLNWLKLTTLLASDASARAAAAVLKLKCFADGEEARIDGDEDRLC